MITSNVKNDIIDHSNVHQRMIGNHVYYDITEHKRNRCQRKS